MLYSSDVNKNRVIDQETLLLLGHLTRASKNTESRMDALLSDLGLSATRLRALCQLLNSEEPISLSQLAACQSFVKSNATQMIDHLETSHLVRRVPDPEDRRATLLQVTDAGKQRRDEAMHALLPLADQLHQLYTPEERAQLLALLERLNG